MSSIEEQVKGIVAEQLGVKEDEVTNDASFVDDLGADSLDKGRCIGNLIFAGAQLLCNNFLDAFFNTTHFIFFLCNKTLIRQKCSVSHRYHICNWQSNRDCPLGSNSTPYTYRRLHVFLCR